MRGEGGREREVRTEEEWRKARVEVMGGGGPS